MCHAQCRDGGALHSKALSGALRVRRPGGACDRPGEAERVFVGSREGGLDDGSNPFLLRIIDRFMVLTVQTWEYHS
jgi:hypothetical protein